MVDYKKKILLITIAIIVLYLGAGTFSLLYNIYHNKNEVKNSFQFPNAIEEKILSTLEKTTNNNKSILLSDLLNSGKWTEIKTPQNGNELQKLENRLDEWSVKNSNAIVVSICKPQYIDGFNFSKFAKSKDFFLIVNGGEWGGALYFYPGGDKRKKYKIMDGDLCGFFEINNNIYFFEGKGYTQTKQGKIYQLEKGVLKWRAKEVVDIGDYPYAETLANNNTMYVVTNSKLIKLQNNKVAETIIDSAFWHGLYPNSIAYDNGYVYIGMRAGVAKINLDSKEIEFFSPNK